MALHAVDSIGDAIDATKALLLPFDAGVWLRLAFVLFFIGSGGLGLNNLQSVSNLGDFGGGPGGPSGPGGGFQLTAPVESALPVPADSFTQVSEPGVPPGVEDLIAGAGTLIVALVGLGVLLALVYGLVSNFMEFVLTQALIDREIHVRRYFGDHTGNGLQLLGFRLLLTAVWLVLAAAVAAVVFVAVLGGDAANVSVSTLFASTGLIVAGLGVYVVLNGVISGFTTVFVVPLMTAHGDGIVGGWSRLWGSITSAPKQYLAYLFFSLILQIGTGIVGAILGLIAFIAVGIPFGLVAGVLYLAFQNTVGVVAAGTVGLLGLIVFVAASALVQVPLTTFLRYYAMLVMGDIDGELDPLPEVRSAVRAGAE